jgi:hypothetical protein
MVHNRKQRFFAHMFVGGGDIAQEIVARFQPALLLNNLDQQTQNGFRRWYDSTTGQQKKVLGRRVGILWGRVRGTGDNWCGRGKAAAPVPRTLGC